MSQPRALVFFAAAGVAVASLAQAQDLGTSRRVQGTAEITSVGVGDVPGHVVGVVEFKGLTFFADGEIAIHTNPATFDLTDGSGRHQGYVVHHFDDGSTSIERYQGEARLSADGRRTVVEGSFECIGGTGRFEGLKGDGTYGASVWARCVPAITSTLTRAAAAPCRDQRPPAWLRGRRAAADVIDHRCRRGEQIGLIGDACGLAALRRPLLALTSTIGLCRGG